jgi:hypothetical protein
MGKFFPIIPNSTASALYISGYSQLISPIVLIQVGILFSFFGRFTHYIVNVIAWSYIAAGIAGIYAANLVPNLWIYLVIYQGVLLIVMGVALRSEKSVL